MNIIQLVDVSVRDTNPYYTINNPYKDSNNNYPESYFLVNNLSAEDVTFFDVYVWDNTKHTYLNIGELTYDKSYQADRVRFQIYFERSNLSFTPGDVNIAYIAFVPKDFEGIKAEDAVIGIKYSLEIGNSGDIYNNEAWYKGASVANFKNNLSDYFWLFNPDYKLTSRASITLNDAPSEFTVTFDSQGGSPVAPYTNVASGSSIAKPDDPTKTGYDFSNWYTDTTFETVWDFTTDVVTEDMTLYALWKTHTSTVFFNSQGGSSVEPIDGVAYGETITAPTAPTRTGYDFGGWYKEEGCITPWDFDNDAVYEDTTLYAKWTIQTFSVTFDSNGGSQVSPYTGVEYGSKINEPSTPEKLENNFDGWYKDSEFETAWDFANDTVTEDITLYAKWVEWSKSRIYNPNAHKGEKLKLVTASKTRETFNLNRR